MPEEMEFGPDLLTLVDDEGVEHQFEVIDTLEIEDDRYIALIPVYDDAEDAVDIDAVAGVSFGAWYIPVNPDGTVGEGRWLSN